MTKSAIVMVKLSILIPFLNIVIKYQQYDLHMFQVQTPNNHHLSSQKLCSHNIVVQ